MFLYRMVSQKPLGTKVFFSICLLQILNHGICLLIFFYKYIVIFESNRSKTKVFICIYILFLLLKLQINKALDSYDAQVLSDLLSLSHSHVSNPRLQIQHPEQFCQSNIHVKHYGEIFAAHLKLVVSQLLEKINLRLR